MHFNHNATIMETINKTVGQIVREDYRAADVFEKFGIDFCCAGKIPLEQSCKERGLEEKTVREELEHYLAASKPTIDFNSMLLSELADYIVNIHHAYVEETGPVILKYLEKVNSVHGKHNPEPAEILSLFKAVTGELAMHMRKEELVLFPYIKRLEAGKPGDGYTPPFASISQPIGMMMNEHEAEGARFARIGELAKEYVPPAHACNTFRVCYAKLQEYERDLHLHIHLENNILFPKAAELEAGKR